MNNKSKRIILFLIVAVCAIVSILLLFPFLRQAYNNSKVKGYYKNNKETFQLFVDEFKKLYSNGIKSISYTDEHGFLLNSEDGQEKIERDSEKCCAVADGLKELKDKYQQNSDLPVFTYAEACFDDNGNMLLSLLVKGTEPFKKSNDSDEYRTCWYLIYIDDDYRDSGSPFAFIRNSGVTHWYIWWQDERTC